MFDIKFVKNIIHFKKMSTGIITATSFFADNGLFKLLKHREGEMNKSYKTKKQYYDMECLDCGEQVKQRGNAKFECRRCRRFVSPSIEDGEIVWYIDEPTGLKKTHADEAMKSKPKKLNTTDSGEELDEESDEEPVPKLPKPSEMVSFLKKTAKSTTGNRVITRKKAEKAAAVDDITEDVEPIIPTAKKKEKKVEKTKDHPISENCPEVEKVMMSVVRLKPGQSFYCKTTSTLYLVDSD